jgi:uncharacterized phage-associated protein
MSSPYSAITVANTVIKLAKEAGINDLSPMKLQKLVYYCHAWNLAVNGNSLIREPVEAWQYGPVINEIYHEFKHYGSDNIENYGTELDYSSDGELTEAAHLIPDEDMMSLNIISQVVSGYGSLSAIQLANLTHRDKEPWKAIERKYSGALARNAEIPNEMIKDYFQAMLPA